MMLWGPALGDARLAAMSRSLAPGSCATQQVPRLIGEEAQLAI